MYLLRRRDCSPSLGRRCAARPGIGAVLTLLLLWSLAGCAAKEQRIAACHAAFALIAPGATIEQEREADDMVHLAGSGRSISCRFGHDTPAGPALLEIEVDGRPLSVVKAQILRFAL